MATQIKSGDYMLTMDNYCMWISKHTDAKDKKSEWRRITGYFNDLGDLLEDFIKKAKGKDAKSLTGTIKKIKKAEDAAIAIVKEYKKRKAERSD